MATDIIIIDGDMAIFQPTMGDATVVVKPGTMTGTGKTTIKGTPVCIEGDEMKLKVSGCNYITKEHLKPGTGTLQISALGGDQLATKTNSGKKAVILKGSDFKSVFMVDLPAQDIKPVASGGAPIPDKVPFYKGTGQFIPANQKVKAT